MIRYLVICVINFIAVEVIAQANFVVGKGKFVVNSDRHVIIKGNMINESKLESDNSGIVTVSGDWENNDNSKFLSNVGTGEVVLDGGDQSVLGNPTRFYDLTLEGGNSIKSLFCDIETYGNLDLIDANLETQNNTHYHYNTNENSVNWNTGFVSSDQLGGYFYRATNNANEYWFPVGSENLDYTYRYVSVLPSIATANGYYVRCAGMDPDVDFGTSITNAVAPLLTDKKQKEIIDINTNFYHAIYPENEAEDAEITLFYHEDDGSYSSVGQWKKSEKWEDLQFSTEDAIAPAVLMSLNKKVNFSILNRTHDAFVLINAISLEDTTAIFIPNAFTPNGDGLNDAFEPILTNIDNEKDFSFYVFNRWGEIIYESHRPDDVSWNGTAKKSNNIVQDGVYVWQFSGRSETDNKLINKTGSVTVYK